MVGDNLETDILFGNKCGIDSLCVLSGNTNEEQAKRVMLEGTKQGTEGVPNHLAPYFAFSEKLKL